MHDDERTFHCWLLDQNPSRPIRSQADDVISLTHPFGTLSSSQIWRPASAAVGQTELSITIDLPLASLTVTNPILSAPKQLSPQVPEPKTA